MSLAISISTPYGIVMSADRRLTITLQENRPDQVSIRNNLLLSDSENKLFAIDQSYGLSYTGDTTYNGLPLSVVLQQHLNTLSVSGISPELLLRNITEHLHQLDARRNTCLFMSGYDRNRPFIYTSTTPEIQLREFTSDQMPYIFARSGDTGFIEPLLKNLAFNLSKMPLQDSIDFVRLLTQTTSDFQKYHYASQTVSRNCDILLIQPDGVTWIDRQKLS